MSLLSRMQTSDRTIYLMTSLLALLGVIDSIYLTIIHYAAIAPMCTILSGCAVVLSSTYASIGPVPLAVLGVVFYSLTLALSLIVMFDLDHERAFAAHALAALGVAGFSMSIVFESIQFFLIHALCEYCALSALFSFGLFLCALRIERHLARRHGGGILGL